MQIGQAGGCAPLVGMLTSATAFIQSGEMLGCALMPMALHLVPRKPYNRGIIVETMQQ